MRKYKYKVIKRKTRMSCIINGKSKYARKYIKNENVYAIEGTLGIMVFKLRRDAQSFVGIIRDPYYNPYIIVRVIPIGKGKTVKAIARDMNTYDLDVFYNDLFKLPISRPPHNTMAYPGVFVVD